MDGFTRLIINDNKSVLALVKTCVTTPTLINTDIRQGAKYAIPLMCETNQKSASAEVSESLIISSDAKKNITDNVAPGSKSWKLGGYITGLDGLKGLDEYPSNKYQPLMHFHTDILWSWFNHGAVLTFKDGNAQIYEKVVIKDLQTSQQKDSANGIPFSLTLKEINTLPMNLSDISADTFLDAARAKKSLPPTGTNLGTASELGSVQARIGVLNF